MSYRSIFSSRAARAAGIHGAAWHANAPHRIAPHRPWRAQRFLYDQRVNSLKNSIRASLTSTVLHRVHAFFSSHALRAHDTAAHMRYIYMGCLLLDAHKHASLLHASQSIPIPPPYPYCAYPVRIAYPRVPKTPGFSTKRTHGDYVRRLRA